jgi:hypothetical protein
MPSVHTVYLDPTKDFEIKPLHAGGFLIKQTYHEPDYSIEASERKYVEYNRGFSTAGDLIDFLNESYSFPRHITSQVTTPLSKVP